MRKEFIGLFLLLLYALTAPPETLAASYAPSEPKAAFAILLDSYTGRVFYEKNADSRAYPASTTKILTLITALEHGTAREIATVSANAANTVGSSCELQVNERYHINELYYGMMLESGNDAAVAVAEHIGGSVPRFVAMMNETARDIGARRSNFTNPSGLPDGNHYTTARDLALIARYAMTNPAFAEMVATVEKDWRRRNRYQPLVLKNTNELLEEYFGANGIKTGTTRDAKRCLVASARRGELQLIAVLLYSEEPCWEDAMNLFDYGFSAITTRLVYHKGSVVATVPVQNGLFNAELVVDEDVILPLLPDDAGYQVEVVTAPRLFAPVNIHQETGYLRVAHGGEELKQVKLFTKYEIAVKEDTIIS
jgi:D-alanyl-D-alanine carboxypeptidase (penicillin-binding protein 5/6)